MAEDNGYDYWYVAGYGTADGEWVEVEQDGIEPEPYFTPDDSWDFDYVVAVVDDEGVHHYVYVYDGWDLDYPIEDAIDDHEWEKYQ